MNPKINATPNNIPVISLRMLPLSYEVNNCKKPSKTIGTIIKTTTRNLGYPINIAIGIPAIIPISSPVQRAQIGNCFPRKKNDLSGLA